MLAAGLAVCLIGIIAIILGLYVGSMPACQNSPGTTTYCPLQRPLWYAYRYSVLGGVIEIVGLVLIGKGCEFHTSL